MAGYFGALGPADILVNNAGIGAYASMLEESPDVYEHLMRVNYLGTVHATLAVLAGMAERRRGHIGNVASVAVTDHLRLRAGYQMMFIESVALAPVQLPATNLGGGAARVDMSGNLFYHGAAAGMEVCW